MPQNETPQFEDSAYQCWGDNCLLGEGAYWHPAHNRVYWVDIKGAHLYWLNLADKQVHSRRMPESICWVASTDGDYLIAGFATGIYLLEPDSAKRHFYWAPDDEPEHNRLNDGKVDGSGRLWFGSMDDQEQRASGHLYKLENGCVPVRMDSGYVVSNGPVYCPLSQRLMHVDSVNRILYQFDLDAEGQLHNKRVFSRFSESMGFPDGMTIDTGGGVWVAQWGGSGICRFTQQGKLDVQIKLPSRWVTSLVFGGDNLNTLFITTASNDIRPEAINTQPDAGKLFEIDMSSRGFKGLPPVPFNIKA